MAAFNEEQRTCEKHGEYTARLYTFNDKWPGGHCPTCEDEKKEAAQQREKQLADYIWNGIADQDSTKGVNEDGSF